MQVQDIQKRMLDVKTQLDESLVLAERVVKGSLSKQEYVEQSKKVEGKMEKILLDINVIVQTM
jgi:hypothetical protein